MASNLNRRADQSNLPNGLVNLPDNLETMSAVELAEAMERALDAMTEETYDEAVINAYMEALEQKAPMPEMPALDEAYSNFQQVLQEALPEHASQAAVVPVKRPVRLRPLLRTGLVAAIAVLCVIGGMLTAQAAGIDMFGAMARWTEEVFSFGVIRDDGAVDTHLPDITGDALSPVASDEPILNAPIIATDLEYGSAQEALDAYGITEVTAPTWIPEGYVLSELSVLSLDELYIFSFTAVYSNDNEPVNIGFDIEQYTDIPSVQVQKTDAPVEEFSVNGVTFYIIENSRNYTAAWLTENYECYLSAADKDNLLHMIYSMFDS